MDEKNERTKILIDDAIKILKRISDLLAAGKLKSFNLIQEMTEEIRFLENDLVFLGEMERK